jgi:hypothetical protein
MSLRTSMIDFIKQTMESNLSDPELKSIIRTILRLDDAAPAARRKENDATKPELAVIPRQ